MPAPPSYCRLSVFLAREAPVGVVLRRGPSAWAQLVLWDRRSDAFQPGQWFHGRVYERRCDLSPDGRLFIYFASKQGRRRDELAIGDAWTAISRPPYFTALELWRNLGTWYGGGVFRTARHVLLDTTCAGEAHPDFPPRGLRLGRCPAASAPWEQRLLLGGWQLVERGFEPRNHHRIGEREVWRKAGGEAEGESTLYREVEDVDFRRFGGPYADTYWLESADDIVPLPGVSWADWDAGGRLVFVRDGRLFEGRWGGATLCERLIYDFNPLRPAALRSPDWARRW
jgi:hypothetical protein